MKLIKKIILVLVLFFSYSMVEAKEVPITLFYSNTCPHCAKEKEFLKEYQNNNDNVVVTMYEVTTNEENSNLLDLVKQSLNCSNQYVPYTVVGDIGLTGYSDNVKAQIIHFVEKYQTEDFQDVVKLVKENNQVISLEKIKQEVNEENREETKTTIPILGQVDSQNISLPLVAIIIGFIDGFNPCAMWILIFLISMLIGSNNKKRMVALGIIFLVTSGLIYLLFMGAWLKVMLSTLQLQIIKIIIGIIAIIGALWNLYSYYKSIHKEVGCSVVDSKKRKKFIDKITKLTKEESFILAALGMVGLAFSVNFVEFSCSAGWPALFAEILALNNLSKLSYFLYLLIYILFYMLDDIIVFMIAVITLKVTGISNKYQKYSHLIGGIIMLIIGILMIVKPEWLMFNF